MAEVSTTYVYVSLSLSLSEAEEAEEEAAAVVPPATLLSAPVQKKTLKQGPRRRESLSLRALGERKGQSSLCVWNRGRGKARNERENLWEERGRKDKQTAHRDGYSHRDSYRDSHRERERDGDDTRTGNAKASGRTSGEETENTGTN